MNILVFLRCHAELMVLGFISLLLTFGQNYISKVCIPQKYAHTMLPCLPLDQRHGGAAAAAAEHGAGAATDPGAGGATEHGVEPETDGGDEGEGGGHRRRLLSYDRRFLSGDGGGHSCKPVLNSSTFVLIKKKTIFLLVDKITVRDNFSCKYSKFRS